MYYQWEGWWDSPALLQSLYMFQSKTPANKYYILPTNWIQCFWCFLLCLTKYYFAEGIQIISICSLFSMLIMDMYSGFKFKGINCSFGKKNFKTKKMFICIIFLETWFYVNFTPKNKYGLKQYLWSFGRTWCLVFVWNKEGALK